MNVACKCGRQKTEQRNGETNKYGKYVGNDEGLVCVPLFSSAVLYDFLFAGHTNERTVNDDHEERIAGKHIGKIPLRDTWIIPIACNENNQRHSVI